MKSDVLIIRAKADKIAAQELSSELGMLGADVVVNVVKSFGSLGVQLRGADKDHSMILLFVTESFAQSVEKTNPKLGRVPASVAIMGFGLRKSEQKSVEPHLPGIIFSSSRSIESFALAVMGELAKPSRARRLTPRAGIKSIWRSPLYIFKARAGIDPTDDEEILVDVTWSAKPTRPQMAPALAEALRATFEHLNNKKLKILDFGAGKLRHTIPLLQRGHSVNAVDYRSLYQKPSTEIKKNLARAQAFKKKFAQLMYPADFAKSTGQYDLILLVNVLNIMPEPLERYFVLYKCNQNLSNGGHLLWFCQHGDADQLRTTSDIRITDGGCTSKKGRKTFYRDYNNREYILRMMSVMGFDHLPLSGVDAGNNHALLFQRARPPAMDINLVIKTSRQVIRRAVHTGEVDSAIAVADVLDGSKYLGYGGALAVALNSIGAGRTSAYKYEDLEVPIIEYVFQKEFTRATIKTQYEIQNGKQRIDIKADYRESSPLRTTLVENMRLMSSWIPIECKNYNKPLGNPEYGQIIMRCNRRHRHFGMILCRDVKDRKAVNLACHHAYTQHDYLIAVFDDSDLKTLLQMADEERYEDIKNAIIGRVQEILDLAG